MALRHSPEQLAALSRLWDEAQEVPPEDRHRWLSGLQGKDAALKAALEQMLGETAGADDGFLDVLPTLVDLDQPSEKDHRGQAEGDAVGPYRLMHELGQGGMGTVWLAERIDGLIKRPVALKLPHPWMITPSFLNRFAREREILASLTHPNIARLYDTGIAENGQPYLALEYVSGSPLIEHCDAQRMGVKPRLKVFLQVLEAVRYAHAHHVVHRDLKPSNILVSPDGQVHLLDFGIAKLLAEGDNEGTVTLTQQNAGALTPNYASPEQLAGLPVTTVSDVYSLGVLLYELLCGRRPYRLTQRSREAIEQAVLNADVAAPSTAFTQEHARLCGTVPKKLRAALRGDLDTIVLKALKKRPDERYESAEELASDIERHLDGAPVLARPDSAIYRYGRLLSRYRLEWSALAGVILSLSAGLMVAVWKADEAREQARAAQAAVSFMEEILQPDAGSAADPARARAPTMRELLDNGARRVDTELQDAPVARLRLLRSLGTMYAGMSLHKEQADMARKRVQLARSLYAPAHPEVLDGMLALAEAEVSDPTTGAQGVRTLRELDRLLHDADAGERDALRRADADRLLARALSASPDFDVDEVMTRIDGAVRILRGQADTRPLARALSDRGFIQTRMEHYAQSAQTLDEALQKASPSDASSRSLAAGIHAELCWVHRALSHADPAQLHCQQASALGLPLHNEDDHIALRRTGDMAFLMAGVSRVDEAVVLMEEHTALSLRLAQQGNFNDVVKFWSELGHLLIRDGRIEKGLETLDLPARLAPMRTLVALDAAALAERRAAGLLELGRYDDAAEALRQAQELRVGTRADPMGRNQNHIVRGRLMVVQGRGDEAAAEAAAIQLSPQAASGLLPDGLERGVLAAEAELARGRFDEALSAAAIVQAHIDRSPRPGDFGLFAQRLESVKGQALWRAGHPQRALLHLETASKLAVQFHHRNSPGLAQAQVLLASVYRELGQRPRALALLAEAKAIHASHTTLGPHHVKPLKLLEQQLAGPKR
jgi:serine/threonine-protein kinase